MADQLRASQDAPIWNAIKANNFKQALKLVDKRLAKKHTEYLEVSGRGRESSRSCAPVLKPEPRDIDIFFKTADHSLLGLEDIYSVSFASSSRKICSITPSRRITGEKAATFRH